VVSVIQVFPPEAVNAIRFVHLRVSNNCLVHRIISLRCMQRKYKRFVTHSVTYMLCIYVAILGRNSGKNDYRCVYVEAAGGAITLAYAYIRTYIYART
jgi:hypothetical protein